MQRFVNGVEAVAGVLLVGMAFLTSVSAFLRYLISSPVPDEYEISRLALGVVACWGAAAAFRFREHIQLDVFWDRTPAAAQRLLSRCGALVCSFAMLFVAWALGFKVIDSYTSGLVSVDLGLPIWPFHAAAWLGTLASILVLAVEVFSPSASAHPLPSE